MAKVGDAGVNEGGNFVKAAQLIADCRVIEITDAEIAPEHGKFKEGVNFTFRYLDQDFDDESKNSFKFTLSNNEVRQRYVDYFGNGQGRNNFIEPLNGVKYERGLVLYKGTGGQQGNPPILFRDATEDEANRVFEADAESAGGDAPF